MLSLVFSESYVDVFVNVALFKVSHSVDKVFEKYIIYPRFF